MYFTPDGNFLPTFGGNPTRSYLYPLRLSEEKMNLAGHPTSVPGIAFSPGGTNLASVGKERRLKMWDVSTGRREWEAGPLPGRGQAVAYSPDGRLLATTVFDKLLVDLWDAQTGKRLLELGTGPGGVTWSARFSPDGRYLAAAFAPDPPDGDARVPSPGVGIWEIKPGVAEHPEAGLQAKPLKTFDGHCLSLVFAPNNHRIAFVDWINLEYYELYVWDDIRAAGKPRLLTRDLEGMAYLLSFTPDGDHLMLLDTNRSIVTLDVVTGNKVASFPTIEADRAKNWNTSVELFLSPDGSKLALTSPSTLGVDVWDPKNRRLLYSLPEQNGTVYCMAWSPDGRRLAISRSNGEIDIWNLPEINRVLAVGAQIN